MGNTFEIKPNKALSAWIKDWDRLTKKPMMGQFHNIRVFSVGKVIKFEACAPWLNSERSDLVSVETTDGGVVSDPFLLPGECFGSVAEALKSEPVRVTATGSEIEIEIGNDKMKFTSDDVSDFPSSCFLFIEEMNFQEFNVSPDDLSFVCSSISKDETRPHINGLKIESGKLISTDGHRLHKVENVQCPEVGVISGETMSAICKLISGKKKSTVQVATRHGKAFFRVRNSEMQVDICSKMIDAEFPPYEQVIPKGAHDSGIQLLSDEIKKIAKRIGKQKGGVALKVTESGSSWTYDAGNMSGCLPDGQGEEITIGVNLSYLEQAIPSGHGNVMMNGCLDPLKIVSGNRLAVVMPMRV